MLTDETPQFAPLRCTVSPGQFSSEFSTLLPTESSMFAQREDFISLPPSGTGAATLQVRVYARSAGMVLIALPRKDIRGDEMATVRDSDIGW